MSALLCSAGLWALLAPAGPMPLATLVGLLLAVTLGLIVTRTAWAATAPVAVRSSGPIRATAAAVRTLRAFDPDTAGRARPRAPGRTTAPSA